MTAIGTSLNLLVAALALGSSLPAQSNVPAPSLPMPEIKVVDLTNCELGARVLDAGNAMSAALLFDNCLSQDLTAKDEETYHALRGQALLSLGVFDLALADFDIALTHAPENIDHLSGKGESLLGMNQASEAVPAFREALKHAPKHVRSMIGLGRAYQAENKPPLAKAFINSAVEAEPENLAARMARGALWAETKEWVLAEQDYSSVIEAEPERVDALHRRGQVRMSQQKFESALADFDAAKALDDDDEALRLDRVVALLQLNQTSDAQLELNQVVEMAPNNVKALMLRGKVYLALENKDKAAADFRQALTIDPNGPYTDEAMEQLRELDRIDWSKYQ